MDSDMKLEAVREFDVDLCEYARAAVGLHMRRGGRSGPGFARWVRGQLAGDLELLAYLDGAGGGGGRGGDTPPMLLSREELRDLALAVECVPLHLWRPWVPWEALHRRSVDCVVEVRAALFEAEAAHFAAASAGFAQRLEGGGLELHDGLVLVGQWVEEVRRVKRALGRLDLLPRPAGTWPTPSRRWPPREPLTDARAAGGSRAEDPIGTATCVQGHGHPPPAPNGPDAGEEDPLDPRAAGRLLGVSAKHVIRLVQEGVLAAANVGRGTRKPRYRIARSDVEAFLRGGRPRAPVPKGAGVGPRAKPAALAGLVDYFA